MALEGLSVRLSRGQAVRLSLSEPRAALDLVEILSLSNFGWVGSLRFMGWAVEGWSEELEQRKRLYISRFPISPEPMGTCGQLFRREAVSAGLITDDSSEEAQRLARRYDIHDFLNRSPSDLAPAQKQLLSAALLEMRSPELVIIDGTTPPYPAARVVVETVLSGLRKRSAIVLVESGRNAGWDFFEAPSESVAVRVIAGDAATAATPPVVSASLSLTGGLSINAV